MELTKLKKIHFSPEKRLEILDLATRLGNISAVCLQFGIERSTFYIWKKRHELNELAGLKRNKAKSISNHPLKTTDEVVAQVMNFCLKNPSWGCSRVASALKDSGINISSPTVQKILIKEKLGTVSQRLYWLEEKHVKEGLEVSADTLKLLENHNPCLKERGEIGTYPGEVLVQDTFSVFDLFPNTYIHVVIDTYSSYAFAYPWAEKSAELAIDLLKVKVLRFFSNPKFVIKKIITDHGYEFTRFDKSYTNFLNSRGICHAFYSGNERNWNGYIERYKKSIFKRYRSYELANSDVMRTNEIIQQIKNDKSNATRSVNGYPNFGKSPSKICMLHPHKI